MQGVEPTCRNMSNLGHCCAWNVLLSSRYRTPPMDRTTADRTSDQMLVAPWICPTKHRKQPKCSVCQQSRILFHHLLNVDFNYITRLKMTQSSGWNQ